MELQTIPLAGADLRFAPAWLPASQANALFGELLRDIPWEVHRIRMFGRVVDSPRLSCWIGDADARYRYSGTLFEPQPWPHSLAALRARLSDELGVALNSVLANRYRNGRDAMGWHRDDEPELGPQPVIASVSLGATRRFRLKADDPALPPLSLDLPHGSLLVMRGHTQARFRHALPRTARPVGERINLTFRCVCRLPAPGRAA